MGDERAMQALARIERAIARIEAAATAAPASAGDDEEIRRLREANEALRGKVRNAIGQIDMLLESGGDR